MKTRIAVDIDNVIFIHHDLTIDVLNEEFAVDLHPDEVDEYDYAACYLKKFPELDERKVRKRLAELMADPGHLGKAAPSLPMLAALRELAGLSADGTGVTVLTARPEELKSATRLALDQHGIAYAKLIHTKDKAMACRANQIRYLIEDCPDHAEGVKMAGVSVFLIDYPYNRHLKATGDNGVWRVTNPIAIPALLRQDLGL